MAPDHFGAQLATRVPTNRISALEAIAFEKSTRHEQLNRADLVRDAVDCYLLEHWDEIPDDEKEGISKESLRNSDIFGDR
jgi:hypothetical protein